MARTAAKEAPMPANFETALAELETIVTAMEGGQLTLEESLASYRRGASLLTYCQGQLQAVQDQVKVLESGLLREFTLDPGGARRRPGAEGAEVEDDRDP